MSEELLNTTVEQEYDASQIQVLEGLEAVRKRPGMYIGSTSASGLHHLVYEIVDNAIDEALAGYCTHITVTINLGDTITVTDNGRGIPVDIQAQTGRPALEVVYTVLHAGGKFGGGGYKVSGGLHGVGASVVNALSEWLTVEVHKEGKIYQMKFARGNITQEMRIIGDTDRHGTIVTFKPEYENGPFPSMLKQELTSAAINFGGATWRVWGIDDNSFNNNIVSSYRSNQIRLRGYNYDQLAAYADRLIDSLSTNRRVSEPEIMDGDAWTLPHNEFTIRYDDERIAATGLDVSDYYTILNTMLYQSRLPSVYNGEELQQVILESGDRDRFDRWHIANAQVGIDSLRTKLSTVGTIEKHRTGISIRRSKQSYEILVGFDFIGSYELGKRLIERTVRQLNDEILPIGFRADSPSHNFGRKEKQQQAWLILLVVAIIYTMCTILFESLRKPLVIILMIPISFIGVFLSFGWSDFIFDQGGFAAFVLLCGIVVNAGIYLINEEDTCAAISGKRGIALYLKAFNHKIVPISLTILSTILGLAPFLYDGPEEVFWFAFAIAAISGTFFSVIALLIYLPIFLPMRRNSR